MTVEPRDARPARWCWSGTGASGGASPSALAEHGIPFVVAEQNRELVEQLREQGIACGLRRRVGARGAVQAHVARAAMLVVATPDAFGVRQMVEIARTLNPSIEVVLRTHSDEEAELLRRRTPARSSWASTSSPWA